ncbi:MAG: hypothetical protein JWM81_397 [Candidatus Saccharibacteria bacterium]|nr:hypothetical protein [Candidatus Saccharibacteria bacterium]
MYEHLSPPTHMDVPAQRQSTGYPLYAPGEQAPAAQDYAPPVSEDTEPRSIGRRRFLKLAVGGAAVWAMNDIVGEVVWSDTDTALTTINRETIPYSTDEGWVVIPGFGSRHGAGMAALLSQTLNRKQPIGYFNYATSGLKMDDIVREMSIFAEPFDTVSLYGHSMGGPTGLEAARQVGKPLNRVILNCSPFSMFDARGGEMKYLAAQLAKKTHYEGDFASTYLGTVKTDIDRHGWRSTFGSVWGGIEKTAHGPSPKLVTSQGKMLAGFDLRSHQESYERIITPQTVVRFAAPENFGRDKTVNDYSSYINYYDFFGRFGVEVELIRYKNGSHADTRHALEALKPYLRQRY